MDIFNRPPSIAEDTLQYTIYPPQDASDKASATALATCISNAVEALLQDFIWNRDAFELKVVPDPESPGSWILEGRMRVGDCVDDEWCTVWLLKEVSAKWDVVISVIDSDGEFLLIESAEALPSWVTPTNSENRVWIHRSRLHLIPLAHTSPRFAKRHRRKLPAQAESDDEALEEDDESYISAKSAAELVRNTTVESHAPASVERLVWQRISSYPAALSDHVHRTKAYLPEDIVKAIYGNPALIQRAVETFYTRDAMQLRTAHRMTRFPPNTSVLVSVRLTRTAYAQLSGQKFFPPKIFGQWKDLEGSNAWKWKDLGMKIAVGFEMLYQESKGRRSTENTSFDGLRSSSEARLEGLQRDSEYQQYIKTLLAADYFKGERQGSAHWKSLEEKAALMFTNARRNDDALRASFAVQVDTAISTHGELPSTLDLGEEPDTWLHVDAESFDNMLDETFRKGGLSEKASAMEVDPNSDDEDKVGSQQAKRLKDLASKVENFIESEGDVDGVRFESDLFSDEDEPISEDEEEILSSEEDGLETLPTGAGRTSEQQAAMDKLVTGLDPSDYGKMPAHFHSNSQRVAAADVQSDIVGDSTPAAETKQNPQTRTSDSKPIHPPIIPRDKYDGVDSDDETDPEEEGEAESDDDAPQVMGDIEIDMAAEEEEFLEFSRQTLGITDDQWAEIVKDRQDRGAFLPSSVLKPSVKHKASSTPGSTKESFEHSTQSSEQAKEPTANFKANPELNSFEAVMDALDAVLAQHKAGVELPDQPQFPQSNKEATRSAPKRKGKEAAPIEEMATDDADEEFDVEAAMEAELNSALKTDGDDGTSEHLDYNLIKNFLESFKSQGGLSGPVSNLSGMLAPDLKFPRDENS